MISANVPVNVTVSVPLPLTPVRPASVASVRMPFWTASVTVSSAPASSDSVMALPFAALKTNAVSSSVTCALFTSPSATESGVAADADRRALAVKPPVPSPMQHADIVAADVRDQGVEVAVAVHVAERDGNGVAADADRRGGGEAARAVADQHADIVAVVVRDQGVEVAVAVHVAERDGIGAVADADRRGGGEAARAVADQHADIVAAEVRDQGVEVAVAVNVAECDGIGASSPTPTGVAAVKPPVPSPMQHADIVAADVRDQGVEVAVAVDVAERDGNGAVAGADRRGGGEAACAVADAAR